jgi:3-deoxy-D-manno-octulosonate 8-phosphate phosphatase (KDO 8-P phosphatase)
MPEARARKIKLLLFDVDGVATDGTIFLIPIPRPGGEPAAALSVGAVEAKGFHAHDGTAISLARLGGLKTGLITRRCSDTVAIRARDLRLDYVYQGILDKAAAFREVCAAAGVASEEAAFMGDDIVDLPPMRLSGLAIAVANARREVKAEAHYTTPSAGGQGAIRDAVEYILRAQGTLERVVEEYLRHA